MKNINICFFSGVIANSGGTERVCSIIANELSNRGYNVRILSFWGRGNSYYKLNDDIKVDFLLNPSKEGKLFRTYIYPIIKLHNYIKKNKIDIFIDVDTVLANYTYYAIKNTNCKWASWEHFNYSRMIESPERKERIKAKQRIKSRADLLIVLTDEDKKMHIEGMNFNKDQIKRIYNPSPFSISNNEYNFNSKIFFSAGRLFHQKGYDMLIDAWKIFEENNLDWKLIIAGNGEEENKLKEKVKSLNLKNINFVGQIKNIEDYYKKASCYVLSSRYEGFPMVILEAESFGLPIIAFDCITGPKEMIKDNGYLVKNQDIEDLARKMLEFAKDENKAKLFSINSKKNLEKLSIDKIVDEWELEIKRLLKDK